MPTSYACRTCGFSFSSGRINWASPTCGSCEVEARAEQRREVRPPQSNSPLQTVRTNALLVLQGLADARATSSPLAFWGVRHSHRVSSAPRSEPPRVRVEPSVPPVPPSARYERVAGERSVTVSSSAAAARFEPLVVVLSLSDTLLYRPRGQTRSSIRPIVRPYLSTFLSYLCRQSFDRPARKIVVVVFSSAKAHNVSMLLRAIGVEHDSRMADMLEGIRRTTIDGDVANERERTSAEEDRALVRLVLSRDLMGLDEVDYNRDIITTKDLTIVWRKLELDITGGTRTTVLVDESEHASVRQPFRFSAALLLGAPATHSPPRHLTDLHTRSQFSQPYSRVPTATFVVDDPRSAFSHDGIQELPSSAPDDTTLLRTIYLLERLRCESNVAAALKDGLVQRAEDEARLEVRTRERRVKNAEVTADEVQEVLAGKGRQVCAEYGVEARREWDGEWSKTVREGALAAQRAQVR